jgi:hypothetical protein
VTRIDLITFRMVTYGIPTIKSQYLLYENLRTVPGTGTRGRGDFIFGSEVSLTRGSSRPNWGESPPSLDH